MTESKRQTTRLVTLISMYALLTSPEKSLSTFLPSLSLALFGPVLLNEQNH